MWNKLREQKLLSFSVLTFTLSAVVLVGTLIDSRVSAASKQSTVAPDATPLVVPPVKQIGNEFTKLAKKLEPSVVYITAESAAPKESANNNRNRRPQQRSEDDEESPGGSDQMERFFDMFRNGPSGPQMPRNFRRGASGTGFIVDKNGYIITNNHVIEKMDKIKVKLHTETTEYRAKLIGTDEETDLAVLKIEPKTPLTPVTISNSDSVQVGDWAVAIGSPFLLEATVTAGIVSATGRDVTGQSFQQFIQTDAAINPGNSGGPLLNINGEVIGVNTMIATRSGGYEGIGFALPMNMAVKVYNSIIQNGRVTRGYIGIRYYANDKPDTLRAFGLKEGVLVQEVTPGGPADKAGLKEQDVILSLNGKSVKDGKDLVSRVSDLPVGSDAMLTLDRDGQKKDVKLTIGDRSEGIKAANGIQTEEPVDQQGAAETTKAKFGVRIRDLNPEERTALGTTEKKGVKVVSVEEDSFAEDIGMQDGDIILWINRQPVNSLEEVRKIQASLKPGDAVAFGVMRQGPGRRTGVKATLSGTLPN